MRVSTLPLRCNNGTRDTSTVLTYFSWIPSCQTLPPTTPAPAPTCVSASTRAHVDAGRATDVLGYAYAKGSRDYLGRTSSFGSATLRQVDASTWERALRC